MNTQDQEHVDTITLTNGIIRRRVKINCSRPILTEQQHKEMVDINNIMENYVKNGTLPNYTGRPLLYVDDTNQPTFEEAHDVIAFAKKRFSQLPQNLKNELNNDYRKLETWLTDPDNQARAIKMGLLQPHKPKKTPEKVETPESPNQPKQEVKEPKATA